MMLNMYDKTHQSAHEVRNQRVSAVMEVSESEKVNMSIRVVPNYNHMHALNVHYYEVIQLYKAQVTDKVVFKPFELFDFQR